MCCALYVVCCVLCVAWYSFFRFCDPLCDGRCVLFVVCGVLFVVCGLQSGVWYSLFVVRCLLRACCLIVCCVLCVNCCLRKACCVMFVASIAVCWLLFEVRLLLHVVCHVLVVVSWVLCIVCVLTGV